MRSEFPHNDRESDPAEEEAWDAHDPRRQKDPYAPPSEPCECVCHHCRRTFLSDQMWFQKINGARDGLSGFWKCPTPNCSGGGFTMDIFPVDPSHPANEGWFETDDDDDDFDESHWEDYDEQEYDEDMEFDEMEWEEDIEPDAEYDPAEPQYQMMDQWACDDDIEGEEWKLGLEPGQRPEPETPAWIIEEEKKYDEPDRRPRELDWTDMEMPERGGSIGEDDIPF